MARNKKTEIEEVVVTEEVVETPETIEGEAAPEAEETPAEAPEVEYYLENGEKCSRSAYIRQEFEKNKSRQDIAKELGVQYYVVYSATANMYNTVHTADSTGNGRSSVSVAKVNKDFAFLNAAGEIVATEAEAVQVPRADLMRELADAGVARKDIKDHFGVAYATVYAATKSEGSTGTRERKMVIDPETGESVKRNDYIRKLFADGMERKAIAKKLTDMTDELVDYATVWAATKPKKEETEEVTEAATSEEVPVEASEEVTETPEEITE